MIKTKQKRIGLVQRKLLLLLNAGLYLSLTRRPDVHFHIIKSLNKEWEKLNNYSLMRAIGSLYKSRLIDYKERDDGTIEMLLTQAGKKKILVFNPDNLQIKKPKYWDKKWRLVIFDIPEKFKKSRDTFRRWLKSLGFLEFQKSVFIFPYDCQKELDGLIELLNLRHFVRYAVVEYIDNELNFKKKFQLLDY